MKSVNSNDSVILYDYWRSSASYRVRIALNIKNVPYKQISVNLLQAQQNKPDYLNINCAGLVPALIINGQTLTQSMAIIEYLDALYPQPALIPKSPERRVRCLEKAYVIAMDTHPVCNLNVVAQATNGEEEKVRWMQHYITRGLKTYEQHLYKSDIGRYSCGEEITIADLCLVPQVYNAFRWGVDVNQFQKTKTVYENCMKLETFARAAPENNKAA